MGPYMTKLSSVLLFVLTTLAPAAHAGWFDWFTPGEWFEGLGEGEARGFYVGGNAGIVRADWGMQRRLGGPTDPGVQYRSEPAYLTVAGLRGGFEPWSWLEIEAEWNFDLDRDEISENPPQTAELDSLSGIYLRPQLAWGGARLYLEAGYNQINIHADCDLDETSPITGDPVRDARLEASCQDFDEAGFAYGAGLAFALSPQSRLLFSWRQIYEDDFDNNGSDDHASARMIGVTLGFGGEGDGGDDDYYY